MVLNLSMMVPSRWSLVLPLPNRRRVLPLAGLLRGDREDPLKRKIQIEGCAYSPAEVQEQNAC